MLCPESRHENSDPINHLLCARASNSSISRIRLSAAQSGHRSRHGGDALSRLQKGLPALQYSTCRWTWLFSNLVAANTALDLSILHVAWIFAFHRTGLHELLYVGQLRGGCTCTWHWHTGTGWSHVLAKIRIWARADFYYLTRDPPKVRERSDAQLATFHQSTETTSRQVWVAIPQIFSKPPEVTHMLST